MQVTAALGKAGALVDAAVRAGANNVDGPSLDTADKSALYNQALKQALGEAKQKAQAIANATGLTLGAALKVREGGAPTPIVYGEALAAKGDGSTDRGGDAEDPGVGDGDVLGRRLKLAGAVPGGDALERPAVRGLDDLTRQEVGLVARILMWHLDDDLVHLRLDGVGELVPLLGQDRERRARALEASRRARLSRPASRACPRRPRS